jgi:fumarate hydratase class II
VTALNPRIGYSRAAEIAKRAIAEAKTIRETLEEEGLLTPEETAKVMDTRAMTESEDDRP